MIEHSFILKKSFFTISQLELVKIIFLLLFINSSSSFDCDIIVSDFFEISLFDLSIIFGDIFFLEILILSFLIGFILFKIFFSFLFFLTSFFFILL